MKRILARTMFLLSLVIAAGSMWSIGAMDFGEAVPAHHDRNRNQETTRDLPLVLTVENTLNVPRSRSPLSWSIPLSRSLGITDPSQLCLMQEDLEVPTQFLPIARWGGLPDDSSRPIAWLLVDALVDLPAGQTSVFYLLQRPPRPFDSPLEITRDDSSGITIDTGAAVYALSRTRFRLFDSVILSDGTSYGDGGGISFSGQIVTNPADIRVEHRGKNRISLWVHGIVQGDLEFTARLHFYRGLTEVCLDFRLENLSPAVLVDGQPNANDYGCPNSIRFDDLSLLFPSSAARTYLLPEGENGMNGTTSGHFQNRLVLIQESSGDAHWDALQHASPRLQSGVAKRASTRIIDSSTSDGPNQMGPWMHAQGITCAVHCLWQNFPKAFRALGDRVEIGLFPGEYALEHEFRPGEFKTHTLWIRHAPPNAPDVAERVLSFGSRLRLMPSVRVAADSGALGPFAPRLDHQFPDYELGTDYQIRESPEWRNEYAARTILDAVSISQNYSWVDYGDIPTDFEMIESPFNFKYDGVRGLVLHAIRNSGLTENSRVWWDMAQAAARHTADIDIFHSRTRGRDTHRAWYEGGFYGHGYHDEDGRTNPHRNRMNPAVSMSGPVSGMFLYGLISGDTLILDSAMELSDNIVWRTVNSDYWEFPQCAIDAGLRQCGDECEGYSDPDYGRTLGHAVKAMIGGYFLTGDDKYIRDMSAIASFLLCRELEDPRDCDRFNIETVFMRNLGYYLHLRQIMGMPDDTDALALLQARVDLMVEDLMATGAFEICYDTEERWAIHDNWLLGIADSLAVGAKFLDQNILLENYGLAVFLDGSRNQFYEGSALSYHSAKEFVNQIGFGHVFLDAWLESQDPPLQHTVSVPMVSGGSMTPSGTVSVLHGDNLVVHAQANAGYQLAGFRVNGQTQPGSSHFALVNVRRDHTLEAIFEPAGNERVAHIPHIAADANWQATVIVDNAGDELCTGQITLFDNRHTVDQIDFSVPANQSRAIALDAGVCGRVTYTGERVFLRQALVHVQQDGVAEFELNADQSENLAFLLPSYQRDFLTWMGIAVMNPSDQVASVSLHAMDANGTNLATNEVEVASRDRIVGFVDTFFPGIDTWSVARIEAEADLPLCGINISGRENERLLFTRAFDPSLLPGQVLVPHIATAWDTWNNSLVFDNFDEAAGVTLRFYRDGNLAVTETIEVPERSRHVVTLNDYRDQGVQNGTIDLGSRRLAVRSGYRNSSQAGMAEFLLDDRSGSQLVFLFPGYARDALNWMGLAYSNFSEQTASVTITAFREGQVMTSATSTIDPGSRQVGLIDSFLAGISSLDVDRIEIIGNADLFGINISGQDQRRLLFMPAFVVE